MRKFLICFSIFLLLPLTAYGQDENLNDQPEEKNYGIKTPIIRIYNLKTFELEKEFKPFGDNSDVFKISVDTADLGSDGYDEIIVSTAQDGDSKIQIFNQNGELLRSFYSLPEDFKIGMQVVAGDTNTNGRNEIITIPDVGGGPQLRIFSGFGYLQNPGFFVFDQEQRSGANIAIGDITNDGKNDIVAAYGQNIEPKIKIFNQNGELKSEFTQNLDFRYGPSVQIGDLDNDGTNEIVIAPTTGSEPLIKILNKNGDLINQFHAYHPAFWGGVNFDLADINKDNKLEIITGAGFSGGSHVRFLNQDGIEILKNSFFVFKDLEYKGGVIPRIINTLQGKKLLVATQIVPQSEFQNHYKMIEVDITKQRLYSYFQSKLVRELKISSGTWKYPTPTGTYNIRSKIRSGRMSHTYGPDNPDNYDLPNVPHILPFYGAYTIHGAYWHNNFGYRMSHGCVNLSLPDAEWMYDWADTYIPLHIYYSN